MGDVPETNEYQKSMQLNSNFYAQGHFLNTTTHS